MCNSDGICKNPLGDHSLLVGPIPSAIIPSVPIRFTDPESGKMALVIPKEDGGEAIVIYGDRGNTLVLKNAQGEVVSVRTVPQTSLPEDMDDMPGYQ